MASNANKPLNFTVSTVGDATFVACDSTEPIETAVIAVLDASGSMAEPSARPGGGAVAEAQLFSRLDIVKHAAKSVASIAASQRGAHLGIVRFSDTATTAFPLTAMDATGVASAHVAIDYIQQEGCTNIWAGLKTALDMAFNFAKTHPNANIHVILLTDGEPTPDYTPARGIAAALADKMAGFRLKPTVSSFGFGFNLDSKLLEEISVKGNGIYGYIPDCSMAGTVFINYCAAAFTTVATNVNVGDYYVGNILAGGTRTLYQAIPVGTKVPIHYGAGEASATVTAASADAGDNAKVVRRLLTDLASASRSKEYAENDFTGLRALKAWIGDPDDGFRTAVMADLQHTDQNKGQLTRAIASPAWFTAWGLNHLISYSRGLACEQCINFKEAALQFYASPQFRAVQDAGNDVFDNMPAPKPSRAAPAAQMMRAAGGGGQPAYVAPAALTTMASLNTDRGGCFTGSSLIAMVNGLTRVDQVKAGDITAQGDRIHCVVRTNLNELVKMVYLSPDLVITPWHPVRLPNGNWVFPAELVEQGKATAAEVSIPSYYTLVMETGHVFTIGGYEVCGLAHDFKGPVIEHEFYGTDAILKQLSTHRGWDQGYVVLQLDDWDPK